MAEIIDSKKFGKIVIEWEGIKKVQKWIEELRPFKIGIITNDNVAKFWLDKLLESLNGDVSTFIVGDGEKFKKLDTVVDIWRKMVKEEFTRKSLIVGLGGGVITDISGFIASTYMRGTLLMLIPTSLMAQVDAAIGGKTGINFFGKNIIGTFYPPNLTLIDPMTLYTLPREEFINGLAEVVKYGIIRDEEFFNFLENNSKKLISQNKEIIKEIVRRSVKIKSQIVEEDLYETNLRRILNFGHTLGHGIESVSNYRIKHGFAVSSGMVVNCIIAEELLDFKESERVINLLESLNLPTYHDLDPKDIVKAMKIDKKAWYGKLVFILPTKIGEVVVKEVPEEVVLNALKRVAK